MTAKELRDKRAKLIADARAIVDAAGDNGMSQEDAAKYDAILVDADKLKAQAERIERQEAEEAREAEARNRAPRVVAEGTPDLSSLADHADVRRRDYTRTPEYRTAFAKGLRFGTDVLSSEEKRALSIGTDTAGGYLAPDEFERTLVQDLVVPPVIRPRATVMPSLSGDKQIPFVSSHGSASWTGEAKSASESDEVFGLKTIGAHKLTRLVKVSIELMQDSAFNLESYLGAEFGRAFNAAEDTAFVSGTGVGRPRGFTIDGTSGVTAASATAVTADELMDLYHAIGIAHRPSCSWYMADATCKAIRKLKDGNGQYLWVPGLQAGQTDTLLGRPVVVSSDMPAMTSGLRSIYFANLRYYWIFDRAGLFVQLLRELYAETGQVGFIGYKRVDARLMLDTAAYYITQA